MMSARPGCPPSRARTQLWHINWKYCFVSTASCRRKAFSKQYFQLICQSWVLALEGGQPGRALIICHFQRFVEAWTKGLPLIGAELGHQYLDRQIRANIPMEVDARLFPPSLYGTF